MNLSLARIPTYIKPTFWILVAVIAFLWTSDTSWSRVRPQAALVVGIAVIIGVAIHELGHAIEARRAGAAPTITLHGFGGHTSYMPTGISEWRKLWISAAGVAYELVAVGAAWLAYLVFFNEANFLTLWRVGVLDGFEHTVAFFLWMFAVLNLYWALFNLVPFGGLDGGHIVEHFITATRIPRPKTVMFVYYIVAGIAVTGLALWYGFYIGAAYAAYLTFRSVRSQLANMQIEADRTANEDVDLQALYESGDLDAVAEHARRTRETARSPAFRQWAAGWELKALSELGREAEVEELLQTVGRDVFDDRVLGLTYFRLGRFGDAARHLLVSVGSDPEAPPFEVGALAVSLAESGQADRVTTLLESGLGERVTPEIQLKVHSVLAGSGHEDAAQRIRTALATRSDGDPFPVAMAFAAAGQNQQVLDYLQDATGPGPTPLEKLRLAWALALNDRSSEAEELIDQAHADGVSGQDLVAVHSLVHQAGKYDTALYMSQQFSRLEDLTEELIPFARFNHACTLARLGRTDEAMAVLKSVDHNFLRGRIDTDEDLLGLHDRDDYQRLVAGLGPTPA